MQRKSPEANASTGDRMVDEISNLGDGPMPIEDRLSALAQVRESGLAQPSRIDRLLLEKIGYFFAEACMPRRKSRKRMRLLLDRLTCPPDFRQSTGPLRIPLRVSARWCR